MRFACSTLSRTVKKVQTLQTLKRRSEHLNREI